MMERSKVLKRTKKRKWSVRALAAMLIAILAMPTVGLKTHAEELTDSNIPNVNVTNKEVEYNSTVQPLTTMVDCEITMAFTLNGLEMTFCGSIQCYWSKRHKGTAKNVVWMEDGNDVFRR